MQAISKSVIQFYATRKWQVPTFQQQCWEAIAAGKSGVLNAPTGSGKTFAIWLGLLQRNPQPKAGLNVLWITPLRALAADICNAMQAAATELETGWIVALRTGDSDAKTREAIRRKPPHALITTPESLHLMLASKAYESYFARLDAVVIDEWHELLGSKRAVQVELALSRLNSFRSNLQIWGISATIGNLDQAMDVLLGKNNKGLLIRSGVSRYPEIHTLFPETDTPLPWAGHIGISMLEQVLGVIRSNKSTLVFTNTRSQTEIWYHALLDAEPDLAGCIAMHHGSIDQDVRAWVERALHEGILKAVVCTSSLDLGVDFRPVDAIVQIGSPKSVARFIQRAGRSGHRPDATSRIWVAPTHALELIETAAIRDAIAVGSIEARIPIQNTFDVLLQYLVTLAVSDGFDPEQIYLEIKATHAFASLNRRDFDWIVVFITTGGAALQAYPDYVKAIWENGRIVVKDKRTAMRHRLTMGTIVSDPMLRVQFQSGGTLGSVEEWFVSKLKPGDVFWFAGKVLELVQVRDLKVFVRLSKKKQGTVPQWMGGRMPLSSCLSEFIRMQIDGYVRRKHPLHPELEHLSTVFELQQQRSLLPSANQLLIEYIESKEGYHVFVFPFEGRLVHEGLGALIAWRIAQLTPISFSIGMNDYGFELLSDQPIPIEEALEQDLFRLEGLHEDLLASINAAELARRKFREIAAIAGLVFQGYPGKNLGTKHLQSSSRLLFDVFTQYDSNNLLMKQAVDEVFSNQLEEKRLTEALLRIQGQKIELMRPTQYTPLCFPILVDRLRERFSNEPIEERIRKLIAAQTASGKGK
jgi:ATP-dependent Lhr-like helicase